MNGLASAPRPIEMAAQPVSANVDAASAIVRMSPLATIGISLDGLDHGPDAGAVDRALESLLAGPAVDDHAGHADLLERAGQVGRGQRLVVPAQPHLHRHRDLHRLDDRRRRGRPPGPSGTSGPSRRRP